MSWFKRIFGLETKSTVAGQWRAQDGWRPHIEGLDTGVVVTPDRALQAASVHAAVRVLADAVSSLPVHVYRRGADGQRERDTGHPLHRLLHDQPCENMTAVEFFEALMWCLCLRGNAYARIVRGGDGRVLELLPLPVDRVRTEGDGLNRPSYTYTRRDGGTIAIPSTDMLHVRLTTLDGVVGVSPIHYARQTIGQALAMDDHSVGFFRNGLRIGGIYKHPGALSETARRNLRESLEQRHAGAGNAYKVMLLEEGIDFQAVTLTNEDAQFLELRGYNRTEIAALFRVPPHMVGDTTATTYNNVENFGRQFVTYSLRPYLKRIEQAIQRDLIAPQEQGTVFAEFLVDDLLRADIQARYAAYKTGIEGTFLTANEVRRMENLPPIAGGDELRNPQPGAAVAPAPEDTGNAD